MNPPTAPADRGRGDITLPGRSPVVERVTGRPARTVATWAADHAIDVTRA